MRIVEDFTQFTKVGGFKKKITTLLINPCFHSLILFRFSNFLHRCHLDILAKIIWYINRILFNVDIDYRADIKGGFVLIHGLGVVIGKDVKAGQNLTVYQGVTIGGSGKSRLINGLNYWQPIIGDNVCLYTNAMVLGPIVISNCKVVKAGSLVVKDL